MRKILFYTFFALFLLPIYESSAQSKASGVVVRKTPHKALNEEKTSPSILPKITPQPFNTPEVQRVISPKGIEAWLIEEKSTPVVAMTVFFKGGTASDPERKTGLSSLVVSLLDEGAGRLNAEEFQEKLAEKAIQLSFDNGTETVSASLATLRPHKEKAFELLRLALTKPRFDRKAVRRVKEQMYASIEARKGRPNALASERWQKLVFKGHPYSRLLPTKEGIRSINRRNLRKYVKNRFAKDNMIIGVAGNISADELSALLDKTFGDLPEKSRIKPVEPYIPKLSARIDVLSMDVPQSAVIFGNIGLARNDPDFYAGYLLDYIFGGGSFAARLFKEVREEKGLAYSIGTYMSVLKASPMYVGTAGSDNAKMAEAIQIIQNEWKKMAEFGPTEKELQDAKTYVTGSYPLSFSSSSGLSSFLASMQYNGLDITYLKNRNDIMNAVTLEQVKSTARRMLLPEHLFFVVVGKPANL